MERYVWRIVCRGSGRYESREIILIKEKYNMIVFLDR